MSKKQKYGGNDKVIAKKGDGKYKKGKFRLLQCDLC